MVNLPQALSIAGLARTLFAMCITFTATNASAAWDQVHGGAISLSNPSYWLNGRNLEIVEQFVGVKCRDVTDNDSAYFMGACGSGDTDDDNFRSSLAGFQLLNFPHQWQPDSSSVFQPSSSVQGYQNYTASIPEVRCDGGNHECSTSVNLPYGSLRFRTTEANGKYTTGSIFLVRGIANDRATAQPTYNPSGGGGISGPIKTYWAKNGEVWFTEPPVSCTNDTSQLEIPLGTHAPGETVQKDAWLGVTCDMPGPALNLSISATGATNEAGWMRQTDAQGHTTEITVECYGVNTTSCNYTPSSNKGSFHILARNVAGNGTGAYNHSYILTVSWP